LNRAAYQHSLDMAERGYLEHDTRQPLPTGQSGPTYEHRIADNGYSGAPYGENIAGGPYTTGEAVFDVWRDSGPDYDTNMRNPDFTQIGIGFASMAGGPYPHYWTADFGAGNDPPDASCGQ
ncbi:MAG TPA: CAP domain-containing protein, partial [Thermomicrobiales bacterium]|nr:CAP domain-containing protein [Thermomicrobiales bacterium]